MAEQKFNAHVENEVWSTLYRGADARLAAIK